MDFMDILLVLNLVNPTSKDPKDWWDELETNTLTDWDFIDECHSMSWQWCINKFFSKEDHTSSRWLKVFLVNSCMPELQKDFDKKYGKIKKSQKGGFIYLYYMLSCLFTMNQELKKAILDWLVFWKTKGSAKVQGKNMSHTELLLLVSCKRLATVGVLHDGYVIDVFEGLCICSCLDFKEMFQVML